MEIAPQRRAAEKEKEGAVTYSIEDPHLFTSNEPPNTATEEKLGSRSILSNEHGGSPSVISAAAYEPLLDEGSSPPPPQHKSSLRERRDRSQSVPTELHTLKARHVVKPGDFGWGRWETEEVRLTQDGEEIPNVKTEEGSLATLESLDDPKLRREMARKIAFQVIGRVVTFRPVIAFVVGITLCITGVRLPGYVNTLLVTVGNANTFMVFTLLGLYFDVTNSDRIRWGQVGRILAARIFVGGGLGLICWYLLGSFMDRITRVLLLVCFILPPAPLAMNYTIEFGYDASLAGLCVNMGMLCSFVLLWSIYFLTSE